MQEHWSAVDEYVTGPLAPNDAALEAAIEASEAAGLPAIQVSPPQGKLRAELNRLVDLRVGTALDLLPTLHEEGAGPFDFTFIDADKENSPAYFAWAVEHSRPGGLIVADNVVRDGSLADPESGDPKVRAQRLLHEIIAAEDRVSATTIQTVALLAGQSRP